MSNVQNHFVKAAQWKPLRGGRGNGLRYRRESTEKDGSVREERRVCRSVIRGEGAQVDDQGWGVFTHLN